MNPPATAALTTALLLAVIDWVAVARGSRGVEYAAKPLTLFALILAALLIDPRDGGQRAWFIVALVFSLGGDIFLMLPRDLFIAGLGSFLVGHLAYIVGFSQDGGSLIAVAVAGLVLAAAAAPLAVRIVSGARRKDPRLALPVALYVLVITAMGATAVGSGSALAATGALLFVTSDAMIGLDRFVTSWSGARLAIMVTYHLAQGLLVLSLV